MMNTRIKKTFKIGGELEVSRLGYGSMRLTGQPGNFGPYEDWEGGKALLRRAAELGVNFFDTAESYGPGTSEEIVADALAPYDGLVVTTKGGVTKVSPSNIYASGSPAALRKSVETSLQRLKVERIDLYQLHRVDPDVPLEESIGALDALRQEGKLRFLGVSNVTLEQLKRALAVAPIVSVQNALNLHRQDQSEMVDFTTREGIAFIPYAPLAAKGFEQGSPLASANEGALKDVANRLEATPGQVALAWLLHYAPNILPIPGTTSVRHLEENIAALNLELSEADLQALARL